MEFVLMTTQHVEAVAEIEKECFSDPWSLTSIRSELLNPLSLWIVAVENGVVAGYVGSQTVLDASDMMNLAVLPQFRGNGIGKSLVQNLIAQLKDCNCRSLTLEVRASNIPAISLYEGLGFTCVGVRRNYYRNPREDAHIMRKEW